MFRLRFLRVLLPLLLVLVALLLWMSWEPRSSVRSAPAATDIGPSPRAEGLSFKEFQGSGKNIAGDADVFEPGDDGSLHLEGIRDLEIEREDRGPLVVSAMRGDREGEEGSYVWRFDHEVRFRETDRNLELRLPSLVIDQGAGEARSQGDIRFTAPELEGRATALLYGLLGQPGELTRPELEDPRGGRINAERAGLLDGIRDIELLGAVTAVHQQRRLEGSRLRLVRDGEGRLRRAHATQGVTVEGPMAAGPRASVRAREMDVRWSAAGNVESVRLEADAIVTHGGQSVAARSLVAQRSGLAEPGWELTATDRVFVQALFGGAPGLLRAERLEAWLDDSMGLRHAEATTRVSFEGRDMRADAERATIGTTASGENEVALFGDERRNARLAQAQTRVAAREIRTDTRGRHLDARGHVEATLLPEETPGDGLGSNRLFLPEGAVHFLSRELESRNAGSYLVFRGAVRGWQGERNLSAEEVVVDHRQRRLEASENVTTRIPREAAGNSATEADFIQIAAGHLGYDDPSGHAVYTEEVRVRFAEGWLEADRVEVEVAAETREVSEIRASGSVRLEVHRTSQGDIARPFSGSADRLLYTPLDAALVLFGDQAPASVRRIGNGGGTTTGRVLTYHLDSGALDVDSGGRAGRIRTGGQ